MPNASDVAWFKTQFRQPIEDAVVGSPFDLDMLTAIACQETGYIWSRLRLLNLSQKKILELCVGDTLDRPNRSAFPKDKAELIQAPNGQTMFDIAHHALVDMAEYIVDYKNVSLKAHKFCHGFGVFQYDLQFFKNDPDYFLQRRYTQFPYSLEKCLQELRHGQRKAGLEGKATLTDAQMAMVAIAYNTGRYRPGKGLKQGYFDGAKYYGERFADYLTLARSVPVAASVQNVSTPPAGAANLSSPTPISTTGTFYRVETLGDRLRVRKTARIVDGNVVAKLPDGHLVRDLGAELKNGFREIETSLNGAYVRGFASDSFLKKAGPNSSVPIAVPAPQTTGAAVPAVAMPPRPGVITTRSGPAGAHSLNEPGQPGRTGTNPDVLRRELDAIVDWLAVERAAHRRYKPIGTTTFCNIYAHDYSTLAGVYLPRVWWTGNALVAIARGQTMQPRLGDTINEMRANDLFRWLRAFGADFGWRQTGNLTKMQSDVNAGAVGLIVARRVDDGKSGHIVAVVPESAQVQARRDGTNLVVLPLQSQAGVVNFRRGTGSEAWWRATKFAEFAFWLHA